MSADAPHCVYNILENGIHRFTFERSTMQAVHEFIAQMTVIYRNAAHEEITRVLVDVRPNGLPPIQQAARAGRKFSREVISMPPARVAYLHSDNTLIGLAQTFLEILRLKNVNRKFFDNDEAGAIAWLLTG